MDMHRGYVSFDLNAGSKNPEKGRIIFHNFNSIQTQKSKNAGAFSHYLEGCEDFNHGHIPKGVLKFLSV